MNPIILSVDQLKTIQLFGVVFDKFDFAPSIIQYRGRILQAHSKNSLLARLNIIDARVRRDFESRYKRFCTSRGLQSLFPNENTIYALASAYYYKGNVLICRKICETLGRLFYKSEKLVLESLEIMDAEEQSKLEAQEEAYNFGDYGIYESGGLPYFKRFSELLGPFDDTTSELRIFDAPINSAEFVHFCRAIGAFYLRAL